jgi:hypothetical protein
MGGRNGQLTLPNFVGLLQYARVRCQPQINDLQLEIVFVNNFV